MMTIQEYIRQELAMEIPISTIAENLGVSQPMVSTYRNHGYNASLTVAKRVYNDYRVVLHPFSEEGLKIEIDKDI